MLNIQRYIKNGQVEREKIAMDIKNRKITRQELENLISMPEIKQEFFEKGYSEKVDKKQWTTDYLDKLSYAVVSESFNKEYLFYLDDVTNYLSKKKHNKKIIVVMVLLMTLLLVVILFILFTHGLIIPKTQN